MENNEFDKLFHDFVQDSRLPYDAALWKELEGKLNTHEKEEPPAWIAIPRRSRLLARYAAAAALAGFIFLMSYFYLRDGKDLKRRPGSDERSIATGAASPADKTSSSAGEKTAAADTGYAAASSYSTTSGKKKDRASAEPIALPDTNRQQHVTRNTLPEDTGTTPAIVTVPEKRKQPGKQYDLLNRGTDEDYSTGARTEAGRKGLALGITGGYNIGKIRNNFSLGVMIKKNLNDRLQLEGAAGIMNGTYESFITHSGIGGPETENRNNDLMYLQVAPSLACRLFSNIYAGAGVDVQRLLSSAAKAQTIDSNGNEVYVQPYWDFGATAKIDYQLSRRFRAGMVYRTSLYSISKLEGRSVSRNYLLIQLSYRLF